MASDADNDKSHPPGYEAPNRSPRALPQPPVEWAPEVIPRDARADFFERRGGMSEWRRRNGRRPSEDTPRVILAYPKSKQHYGRT
jgi:hypothetical protein